MPGCFKCDRWYNDPNIDDLSPNEFMELVSTGDIDPGDFDCGDVERHAEIDAVAQNSNYYEQEDDMQIIPVSVLIEICKAIEGDKEAMEKAAESSVPLIPPFSNKLSKVVMFISDTEVRRWALNELGGVEDGSNSSS